MVRLFELLLLEAPHTHRVTEERREMESVRIWFLPCLCVGEGPDKQRTGDSVITSSGEKKAFARRTHKSQRDVQIPVVKSLSNSPIPYGGF